MTFSIPRTNVIASTEGFIVEVTSPSEVRYSENGEVWRMDAELLTSDATPLAIYSGTLEPVGEREALPSLLSSARRDEIIANIKRAFRFRGIDVEIA
jgi:hypothetical protein